MLLIGLGHKARQGKSTAALAMLEATPLGDSRLFSFADALRAEVSKAARQSHGYRNLIEGFQEAGLMPGWVRVEEPLVKQRTLLQWWGTDYRRAADPDYWVKRLFSDIGKSSPEVAIVTDVRFPNEADAIKAKGGVLVRVVRQSEPDVQVNGHPSENALDGYDGWDYVLTASSAADLKTKAANLYKKIARLRGTH
jgi:hypothetical protein